MTEFHCEQCGVGLIGDEVMCDSCGEEYVREGGPTVFVDGVEVSKTSQVYVNALESIFGRLMR